MVTNGKLFVDFIHDIHSASNFIATISQKKRMKPELLVQQLMNLVYTKLVLYQHTFAVQTY